MSQFPLYSTLIKNLPEKDLTICQKKELVKKINSMDTETHELIYVLTKSFNIENDKSNLVIPYKGIITKDKIEFDLSEMPNKLRQLLYKFVILHNKKLKEDEEIKKK